MGRVTLIYEGDLFHFGVYVNMYVYLYLYTDVVEDIMPECILLAARVDLR